MNPTQNSLTQIADILQKSEAGVIVLPANPQTDSIAAATSLYMGLTKMGKNVALACAISPKSDLLGTDKIKQAISTQGDTLVISIPYTDGTIDKVDYGGIEGNYLNVLVLPGPKGTKIDPKSIQYSYRGGTVDFVITVDAANLNSLGEIYTAHQKDFQGKTIINIDRHLVNTFFGTVNYVNKTSSSTSELVLRVLQGIRAEVDKDMATNLYAGLTVATNNFTSYSVNADTFEAAAYLLKSGAVKKAPPRPIATPQYSPQMPPQPARQPQAARPVQTPYQRPQPTPRSQQPHPASVATQPAVPPPGMMEPEEIADDDDRSFEEAETQPGVENKTPQDWLKPKIFRGGDLI